MENVKCVVFVSIVFGTHYRFQVVGCGAVGKTSAKISSSVCLIPLARHADKLHHQFLSIRQIFFCDWLFLPNELTVAFSRLRSDCV